jgi:hypothetical protein
VLTLAAAPPSGHAQSASPSFEAFGSKPFQPGAYVEAFYQWNLNDPSNGITNFRGFDNRHNAFTLSNVALDARWDDRALLGRLTLQVGHTPSSYYLAEPARPGTSSVNANGPELWKYVQQAYAGYRFSVGRGLEVSAGIFLSPIGPESMAVRDNWNWSRSNLFFGLPFYHTGVRATYALTERWTATLAAFNGWNSVIDNNRPKSLSAQMVYRDSELSASWLYFGGVERADESPEGRAWRSLFDAHATFRVTTQLELLLHGNGGFEPNQFGVSYWAAGALYGRLSLFEMLSAALRQDAFYEQVAQAGDGKASPLFWPVSWVTSTTATLDFHPGERVSFRLEYRHDQAEGNIYFWERVAVDDDLGVFIPNRRSQDTLTLGATSWF